MEQGQSDRCDEKGICLQKDNEMRCKYRSCLMFLNKFKEGLEKNHLKTYGMPKGKNTSKII